MTATALSPDGYVAALPADRSEAMNRLRETLRKHLPKGFEEAMSYGMPAFVVPLSRYPNGYHCKKGEPLPFISIASQKNYIAFHHMGLYMSKPLLDWFEAEWPKHSTAKLDMGKGCVRFKKPEAIPFGFIGMLAEQMTPDEWIACYESALKK